MYLSASSTICDKCETYCCESVCGPWKCQSSKPVLWLVYRCVGVRHMFLPIVACVCTHACNWWGSVIKSYLQLFVFYYQMRCLWAIRMRSWEGLLHSLYCSATDSASLPHDTFTHVTKSSLSWPFFHSSWAWWFISPCHTHQKCTLRVVFQPNFTQTASCSRMRTHIALGVLFSVSFSLRNACLVMCLMISAGSAAIKCIADKLLSVFPLLPNTHLYRRDSAGAFADVPLTLHSSFISALTRPIF